MKPKNRNRERGQKYERELTAKLRELGLDARHVPASGAGQDWEGDVQIEGIGWGEVKYRKDGFVRLHRWLEGNEFLALRAPQAKPGEKAPPWLVVMTIERWVELVQSKRALDYIQAIEDGWKEHRRAATDRAIDRLGLGPIDDISGSHGVARGNDD